MRKTLVLLVLVLFFLSAIALAFEPAAPLLNDFFQKTGAGNEEGFFERIFLQIFDFFKGGVSGYVGYSEGSSANLTIWDDSDFAAKYIDGEIFFYANFTNETGPLNDLVSNVSACFNSGCSSMSYNSSSGLWEYSVTLLYYGVFNWSVNATSSAENLTANDTFVINNTCLNVSGLAENYTIRASRAICSGTHITNNSIIFEDVSSIDLNCNNSILAAGSSGTAGIIIQNATNITVHDCRLENFAPAIIGKGATNIKIRSSFFRNSSGAAVFNASSGINISSCSFNSTQGIVISLENITNSSVYGCAMFNSSNEDINANITSYLSIANTMSNFNNNPESAVHIVNSTVTQVRNLSVYNSHGVFGAFFGVASGEPFLATEINNSIVDSYFENISTGAEAVNLTEEFVANNSLSSIFIPVVVEGVAFASVNQINFKASNIRVRNISVCAGDVNNINSVYNNLQFSGCNMGFGHAFLFIEVPAQKIAVENSTISNSQFGLVFVYVALNSSSSFRNVNLYNLTYAIGLEGSNITGAVRNIRVPNSSLGVYAIDSSLEVLSSLVNASESVNLRNSSVSLINVTFDKSAARTIDDTSILTVKWLLDAEARNSLSSLLENVNVTAWDVFNETVFSFLTDSSGRIPTQSLTQFVQNSTDIVNYTNYTVNASKEMYILPLPVRVNLNESKFLQITLLSNQSLVVYSPLNGTYYNISTINLTYRVLFASPNKCWYYNTTNQRVNLTGCANTTFYASDGQRNITVYANDTSGNISFSRIMFYVDTVVPAISNVNVSEIGNTTAKINWTTSENATGELDYGTSASLGTRVSDSSYNTSHIFRLATLTNYQTYYFNVTSCDRARNCRTAGNYTFSTQRGDYQPTQLHVPEAEIIVQELVASELTTTPQKTTLTPGSRYIFTINSERHEIKLREVYKDSYVVFDISSDPVNISAKKDETVSVDINRDGTDDMKVHVLDIFMTKVTFEIFRILPPPSQNATPPVEERPAVPPVVEPQKNQTAPAKEGTFFERYSVYLLAAMAAVIACLVGGGAILMRRRKTMAPVFQKAEKVAPKMSHLEQLMEKVYGMLKEKKIEEDIKRVLEELNLDGNVIKSVLFEMNAKDNRLDQLVKYTKQQFDRGKTVEEVRETLQKAGWAKNIVELATEE